MRHKLSKWPYGETKFQVISVIVILLPLVRCLCLVNWDTAVDDDLKHTARHCYKIKKIPKFKITGNLVLHMTISTMYISSVQIKPKTESF
jgi:hypothetical protein